MSSTENSSFEQKGAGQEKRNLETNTWQRRSIARSISGVGCKAH